VGKICVAHAQPNSADARGEGIQPREAIAVAARGVDLTRGRTLTEDTTLASLSDHERAACEMGSTVWATGTRAAKIYTPHCRMHRVRKQRWAKFPQREPTQNYPPENSEGSAIVGTVGQLRRRRRPRGQPRRRTLHDDEGRCSANGFRPSLRRCKFGAHRRLAGANKRFATSTAARAESARVKEVGFTITIWIFAAGAWQCVRSLFFRVASASS
jgi:hypothetical protein